MNNVPDDSDKAVKQAKTVRTLRIMWMVMIPIFVVVILLRLYSWNNGQDNLSGIFAPSGMVFLALTQIVGNHNKPLYYTFLILALILVIAGLVTIIVR